MFVSWLQELVEVTVWFLINLLCRLHSQKRHCQDSRSVEVETQGVKYRRTEHQTPLHESSSEFCWCELQKICWISACNVLQWMFKMSLCVISCRSPFLKDKALNLNDQESLMPTINPASLRLDMTENDEENLFDLEWLFTD